MRITTEQLESLTEYRRVCTLAWAKYNRAEALAREEYHRTEALAWADCTYAKATHAVSPRMGFWELF